MKISLKNNINPVSYVKSHFSEVLCEIRESQQPMVITQNGKSSGILLDIETWEQLQRRLELLKLINEGENSVTNEGVVSLADLKKSFKDKYDL